MCGRDELRERVRFGKRHRAQTETMSISACRSKVHSRCVCGLFCYRWAGTDEPGQACLDGGARVLAGISISTPESVDDDDDEKISTRNETKTLLRFVDNSECYFCVLAPSSSRWRPSIAFDIGSFSREFACVRSTRLVRAPVSTWVVFAILASEPLCFRLCSVFGGKANGCIFYPLPVLWAEGKKRNTMLIKRQIITCIHRSTARIRVHTQKRRRGRQRRRQTRTFVVGLIL